MKFISIIFEENEIYISSCRGRNSGSGQWKSDHCNEMKTKRIQNEDDMNGHGAFLRQNIDEMNGKNPRSIHCNEMKTK